MREYGSSHYAVYEINALGGADELRAITQHSQRAAEKIAEIMESDHLEYLRHVSPEKIGRRNVVADSLRAAVITAYESGVFEMKNANGYMNQFSRKMRKCLRKSRRH